jgi:hypothetical protein
MLKIPQQTNVFSKKNAVIEIPIKITFIGHPETNIWHIEYFHLDGKGLCELLPQTEIEKYTPGATSLV